MKITILVSSGSNGEILPQQIGTRAMRVKPGVNLSLSHATHTHVSTYMKNTHACHAYTHGNSKRIEAAKIKGVGIWTCLLVEVGEYLHGVWRLGNMSWN